MMGVLLLGPALRQISETHEKIAAYKMERDTRKEMENETMNQYEIELRDKYFEKAWDQFSDDFKIESQKAESGESSVVLSFDERLKRANRFADNVMAERKEYLAAIEKRDKEERIAQYKAASLVKDEELKE